MRTTLALDDELVAKAQAFTGLASESRPTPGCVKKLGQISICSWLLRTTRWLLNWRLKWQEFQRNLRLKGAGVRNPVATLTKTHAAATKKVEPRHEPLAFALDRLAIDDEVGYLSYSNRHADLLFELVSRRYEHNSTLVTTNRPFAED